MAKKPTENSDPAPKNTLVQPVIEALLDESRVFPHRYLAFFSDISENDLRAVREAWPKVPVLRKIALLSDLEAIMESDSLLSCDALGKFALQDEDPLVRSQAISLLWECDDSRLIDVFEDMIRNDPSDLVQISAAAGLGRFVLMGELDEIPDAAGMQAVRTLRDRQSQNPPRELQQEILKSLAYMGGAEISAQIEKAFAQSDPSWKLAAVIAMGRTADERWEDQVFASLENTYLPIQSEAVKAAGEIELESARLPLLDMLEAGVNDLDLRLHIIWALARIGGEDVKQALNTLIKETEDDEEIDVIEMALEHLDFTDELPDLDL